MKETRQVALVLAPSREAVSGVSTHLDMLLRSNLAKSFCLVHFQVGSEGRVEGPAGRCLRLLASPFLLAVAILRRNAVLVHLNTSLNPRAYWRDVAYLLVSRLCGVRVLYQVHGGAFPEQMFPGNPVLTAFLRWTLGLPDAVVVLGRPELEAYRSFVPRQRLLALPNAIDCRPYANLTRAPTDAASPLRLLYIGRLMPDKGIREALQAVRLVRDRGFEVRLAIAGSGPEEKALRRLAAVLQIEHIVTFVGPVFGDAKQALLGGSDVLVLASHAEGLPYALLEAMAAGVPVIATRVGAIPEVVQGGVHGLFVPVRDPDAIARSIIALAEDREWLARMSGACRHRIATGYSIDQLAAKFCLLYSELLAVKRVASLS